MTDNWALTEIDRRIETLEERIKGYNVRTIQGAMADLAAAQQQQEADQKLLAEWCAVRDLTR